jgi:hypothetical protein
MIRARSEARALRLVRTMARDRISTSTSSVRRASPLMFDRSKNPPPDRMHSPEHTIAQCHVDLRSAFFNGKKILLSDRHVLTALGQVDP